MCIKGAGSVQPSCKLARNGEVYTLKNSQSQIMQKHCHARNLMNDKRYQMSYRIQRQAIESKLSIHDILPTFIHCSCQKVLLKVGQQKGGLLEP